jgi:uncharacterized membrane protein YidH (DUF202 family)
MDHQHESLETLRDIKRIMDRSSRFISLSGLSGVSAGVFALIGAWFAYNMIHEYYVRYNTRGYSGADFRSLEWNLFILACSVLLAALVLAFFFTWRRTRRHNRPMWDHTSRKLLVNLAIPLVVGGVFVLGLLSYNDWRFVAPACLLFYGLALVNASKYTLTDIRYLGFTEIALGLLNMWFIGYGLYFWAVGFGVMHIIYGLIMWMKYENKSAE